ncbi:sensor histidine kinase [Frondihabitans australicus]|nr:histidine kinase [Frondihabitans australicus]
MPPSLARPTGLGPWLNTVGVLVVGYWLLSGHTIEGGLTPTIAVIGCIALAAWGVRVRFPSGLPRDILTCIMLVGGSLMAAPTQGLLITTAVIAVSGAGADRRRPIAFSGVLAVVGMAIVTATTLLTQYSGIFLLGCGAGFALGVVVGYSRRQAVLAQDREIELVERRAEADREHERSALLADRATIARDIHDVLAHSLGGLVIQLDAVDALLEAGRTDEAAARVTAARTLAADGLGEARRAVAALRDPSQESRAADSLAAPDAVDHLLDAHAGLGGRTIVEGRYEGDVDVLATLDGPHRRALAAITREALSNARRHAPGEDVSVVFGRESSGILRTVISNRVPASVPGEAGPGDGVGGGHGLLGMRERIAELGDASTLTGGVQGGRFVVDVRLVAGAAAAAAGGGQA